MYNVLEDVLKNQDYIYIVNGEDEKIKKAWKDRIFSEQIPDNSFVLIKGRVMIDDYNRFELIANNYDELDVFFGGNGSSDFDSTSMEIISLLIKVCYQNELFIKVLPYPNNHYLRFIGNLNRKFFRNSIESITFKYSTNPVSDWYFFGHISSIFPKD